MEHARGENSCIRVWMFFHGLSRLPAFHTHPEEGVTKRTKDKSRLRGSGKMGCRVGFVWVVTRCVASERASGRDGNILIQQGH